MEAYYVYMLRCRGGSLYTGMTNDVARRMAMHCSGRGAKYTRAHPPEALAALWRCGDKITASRLGKAQQAGVMPVLSRLLPRRWERSPHAGGARLAHPACPAPEHSAVAGKPGTDGFPQPEHAAPYDRRGGPLPVPAPPYRPPRTGCHPFLVFLRCTLPRPMQWGGTFSSFTQHKEGTMRNHKDMTAKEAVRAAKEESGLTTEQIARRLSPYGRRKRPRLQGLDDEQLVAFMRGDMAAREPFYAQASLVVDCDPMSDDELVEHIVQTFSDRG